MSEFLYAHTSARLVVTLGILVAAIGGSLVVGKFTNARFGGRFGFPAALLGAFATFAAGIFSLVSVVFGVGQVATEEIAGRVLDKYGDQITEVGVLRGSGDSITSSWVINGQRSVCTIDTADPADPIVSCGDELPLPIP